MSSVRQKLMRVASNSCGSALVGVAALAIVLSIAAAGLIMVATSASRNETLALNDTRAFLAAESGMLLGAKWINNTTNWQQEVEPLDPDDKKTNIVPNLKVNNMDVQVDIQRTSLGVLIISWAKSSSLIGYDKEVSQDATPYDSIFPPLVFDKAIICDQEFDFNGCGSIVGAENVAVNIHSNEKIDLIGNINVTKKVNITSYVEIAATSGNMTFDDAFGQAPTITTKAQDVFGDGNYVEGDVDYIPIPDIDLTPWFYKALADGEVYNGYTLNAGSYTPPGGIIWVNGDVSLGGQSTFNGTIIATGNVSLAGGANVNGPNNDFAIASIGGNVTHNSNGKIYGLVYAKIGKFALTGNGAFEGQVIAKLEIDIGGTPDAIVYPMTTPTIPDTDDPGGCLLVTGSWWEKNI